MDNPPLSAIEKNGEKCYNDQNIMAMNKLFRVSNPKLLRALIASSVLLLLGILAALFSYDRPDGEANTLNVSALVCHYIDEKELDLISINESCSTATWSAPTYVAEFEGCNMTNVGYTLQSSKSSSFDSIYQESTTYNTESTSLSSEQLYKETYYYRARFFDPEDTENVSKWSETLSCYNESASSRPVIGLGVTTIGAGGGGSGIPISSSSSSSNNSKNNDSNDTTQTISHESGSSENRLNEVETEIEVVEYSDITEDNELFACVTDLSKEGIFSGYPDGTFKPHNPINRAELAKVIINSFSADEVNLSQEYTVSVFKDTYTSEWYYSYIQKAYEKGIIQGYTKESYQPEGVATRAHVLKMALIAAGLNYEETENTDLPFTDLNEEAWYMEYIPFAYASGIIKGYNDHTFRPDQPITRAEAACIIKRTKALSASL